MISNVGSMGCGDKGAYAAATLLARSTAADKGCSPNAPSAGSPGEPYSATRRYLLASWRPPAGNSNGFGRGAGGNPSGCGIPPSNSGNPGLAAKFLRGASAWPAYIPALTHKTAAIHKLSVPINGR